MSLINSPKSPGLTQGQALKGVVWNFGHRTSYPSEPVCYLSLETVFNTFHSVLVAEIAGARLVQVEGNC